VQTRLFNGLKRTTVCGRHAEHKSAIFSHRTRRSLGVGHDAATQLHTTRGTLRMWRDESLTQWDVWRAAGDQMKDSLFGHGSPVSQITQPQKHPVLKPVLFDGQRGQLMTHRLGFNHDQLCTL